MMKREFLPWFAALLMAACGLAAAYWLSDLPHRPLREVREPLSMARAYTEALAAGQSYLKAAPDPRLLALPDPFDPKRNAAWRILDASLFGGRYYVYFGVVPFLGLLVPWFILTGGHLSMAFAVWAFCACGTLAYCCALASLARRWYPGLSAGALILAMLTVLVANGSWVLLPVPSLYDLEPAGAYSFLGLAVLLLSGALASKRASAPWLLAGAGAAAGLAIGCRPNLFPAVGVLSAWVAFSRPDWDLSRRRKLAAMAPLVAILAALAAWNHHRFGSMTEFGYRYQLMTMDRPAAGFASPRFVPYNLLRYLAGLPRLGRYFPFILSEAAGPLSLPPGHEPTDQVYGWCLIAPALALSAACFIRAGNAPCPRFGRALSAAALGNLGLLTLFGNGAARYFVDFQAPLSLAAGIGVAALMSADRTRTRRLAGLGSAALVAWSAIATLCVTVSLYDFFSLARPRDMAALARPFNSLVYLGERVTGDGPRGLSLLLEFPKDRLGSVEPLVVIGGRSAQDYLYAYYSGPGQLRLGFESTGYGGPVSAAFAVDYDRPHQVELRYGSFLPPDDHPLLGGMTAAERAMARRMLTVLVDGAPVLDGWAEFHVSRGAVYIGESPDVPAFGRRFTGRIIGVEHPLLVARASPSRWDAREYGALELTLRPASLSAGTREPLVSCGSHNQGGTLALEHLAASEARLVWLPELGPAIESGAFPLPGDRDVVLDVESGSLLPPVASSLWPGKWTLEERRARKSMLLCRLDGVTVWSARVEQPDTPPTTVTVGQNSMQVGGVAPEAASAIQGERRLPWE